MENISKLEYIYLEVENMYPGLVVLTDNELFLSDVSICTEALRYNIKSNYILLSGMDFTLQLSNIEGFSLGFLRMDFDLELSDESCINLYKYDITIQYNCPMTLTVVKYDQVLIERKFIIKNIMSNG